MPSGVTWKDISPSHTSSAAHTRCQVSSVTGVSIAMIRSPARVTDDHFFHRRHALLSRRFAGIEHPSLVLHPQRPGRASGGQGARSVDHKTHAPRP